MNFTRTSTSATRSFIFLFKTPKNFAYNKLSSVIESSCSGIGNKMFFLWEITSATVKLHDKHVIKLKWGYVHQYGFSEMIKSIKRSKNSNASLCSFFYRSIDIIFSNKTAKFLDKLTLNHCSRKYSTMTDM